MKHYATRASLLCLLLSLTFVACKKHLPGGVNEGGFPPFKSPLKKVSLYSPETGALYATREYTYDDNLRLETISSWEGSFTLTYKLMYSGNNRLDSLVGIDSMNMPPTVYYQYDTAGIKYIIFGQEEIGKAEFLRPPYPFNWDPRPQQVVKPVSYGYILDYTDSVQNITRQAAALGEYLESEHFFSYSNVVNPEYEVLKQTHLAALHMISNAFILFSNGIDVASPMLPAKIKKRVYDTPVVDAGAFSFGTDNHLRVIKTFEVVDGVSKLVRTYEYY